MERLLDEEARAVKGMEGDLAAKRALSVQLQGERCFVAWRWVDWHWDWHEGWGE